MNTTQFRPLTGIRVLDFSRALAGPYCTLLLADLGADVVKIEPPEGDETRRWAPPHVGAEPHSQSSYFVGVNRNKRSIVLNLKHRRAKEVVRRLVNRADVLVENFRPGVMRSLGLEAPGIQTANPGLVWCSISAFGQNGPWCQWKGYDLVVQAMSGLMSITGSPETSPTKVGVAISDLAGGMQAAQGITAALLERSRTGQGRYLDVSLLDSVLSLMSMFAPAVLNGGHEFQRIGNAHPQIVPYQEFATADTPIVIAVTNENLWRKFCVALGREDLIERFAGNEQRCSRRDELIGELARTLRERPAQEWLEKFRTAGVPASPVSTLNEVLSSEHVQQRGIIQNIGCAGGRSANPGPCLKVLASPLTRSNTPGRPAPLLGQDTDSALREVGYSDAEIAHFRSEGVIG